MVGSRALIDPTELTPKVILGGKGSGKTHILRYYSFPLQCVRANERGVLDVVNSDGYVGIYVRCGGLDASRFSGKAQSRQTWATVFTYYMDLWLSHRVLDIFHHLTKEERLEFESVADEFFEGIMELFDSGDLECPRTLAELLSLLRKLQREIDFAVNNAAITGQLKVTIRASPGRLVFGVPENNHFNVSSPL